MALATENNERKRAKTLVNSIAPVLNVRPMDVFSNNQKHRVVEARAITCYIMYLGGATFVELGEIFDKEHSSIAYYCNTIEKKLNEPHTLRLVKFLRTVNNKLDETLLNKQLKKVK